MTESHDIFSCPIDSVFIDCPYCGESNRFIYNVNEENMEEPHITVCKNCKSEIKFIEKRVISFLI